MTHEDELPVARQVTTECDPLGTDSDVTEIYECSDTAIGCDVDEWYPELEYGYYVLDAEFHEVIDHTTDLNAARAFALGYEIGAPSERPVPLFDRSHDPRLESEL